MLGQRTEMAVESPAPSQADAEASALRLPGAHQEQTLDGPALLDVVAAESKVVLDAIRHADSRTVNAKDPSGWSVLHWAAFRGNGDVCAEILARSDFKHANAKCQW